MGPDEPEHDDRELDDALRAHLQGAGARLEVTPATLAQVEARGRQRRRRRRSAGALVGVLAVVGAVAGVGSLVDGDDGDPIATEGLPATTTAPPDAVAPSTTSAAEAGLGNGPMSTGPMVASTVVAWKDGFLAFQHAFFSPLPQPPPELPQELIDRFPPEVVELFADGMPATLDEAMIRLEAAGLLDVVTGIIDADPELMEAIGVASPPARGWEPLWSPDGENWVPVEGSVPSELQTVEEAATDGNRLVVTGNSFDPVSGERETLRVASTSDLLSWEVWDLPSTRPTDLPDWVDAYEMVRSVAVQGDAWLVAVELSYSPRIEPPASLLEQHGASGSSGWSMTWDSSRDGVEFGFGSGDGDTASGESVFVPWEELGIDPEDVDRYMGGAAYETQVFRGRAGAPPTRVGSPSSVQQVVATSSGFALLGAAVDDDGTIGSPLVFVSADGTDFRPAAAQPGEGGAYVDLLAPLTDGVVAVVVDQDGTRLLQSDALGSSWRELTVPGLPEGATLTGEWSGVVGSLPGLALQLDAAARRAGPVVDPDAEYVPDLWLIASRDGETWLVEQLPERREGGVWYGGPVLGVPGLLVPELDGWTLAPFN